MFNNIHLILFFGFGLLSTIFIIFYNNLHLIYDKDYACYDFLNKKLGKIFKYNFCLWNLSHIFIFCFFCLLVDAKFNILLHLIVFLSGVSWLVFCPYSKEGNTCNKSNNIVYSDTNKPRLDDLVFNLLGQILYISLIFFKIL